MRLTALAMGLYEWLRRCPPRVTNVLIMMVALAVMAKLILKQPAITADAYITFRVVDNFVQGFGLLLFYMDPNLFLIETVFLFL